MFTQSHVKLSYFKCNKQNTKQSSKKSARVIQRRKSDENAFFVKKRLKNLISNSLLMNCNYRQHILMKIQLFYLHEKYFKFFPVILEMENLHDILNSKRYNSYRVIRLHCILIAQSKTMPTADWTRTSGAFTTGT